MYKLLIQIFWKMESVCCSFFLTSFSPLQSSLILSFYWLSPPFGYFSVHWISLLVWHGSSGTSENIYQFLICNATLNVKMYSFSLAFCSCRHSKGIVLWKVSMIEYLSIDKKFEFSRVLQIIVTDFGAEGSTRDLSWVCSWILLGYSG